MVTKLTAERLNFIAALATVYLVWGSTYFAIKVVVASIPPLLAAGVRFSIAGLILYLWALFSGAAAPTRREWKNLLIVASLMFFIGYSGLFWAEKILPSGLTSVLVATLPLWTLALEAFVLRTQRLNLVLSLGLLVGFVGVFVISGATGAIMTGAQWLPILAVLVSVASWAGGSILIKRLALPASQVVSAGAQMLAGGSMLLLASFLVNERGIGFVGLHSLPLGALLGLVYLIFAGSLAAFSAYVWLLRRMEPTRLSSYAYVNPVVALALGYYLGGEHLRSGAITGSVLVLLSTILVLGKKGSPGRRAAQTREIEDLACAQGEPS